MTVTNEQGVTEGGETPKPETPPVTKPEGKPEGKPDPKATKPEPASGTPTQPAPEEPSDDEELATFEKNGKKFISLSQDKFKDRLNKATKKELKELFGTSDRAELLRWKKQFDDFQKEAEERKREEMTERQKIEADKNAALDAQKVAERRADRAVDSLRRAKTEKGVRSAAREYVHGEKIDMAIDLFRAHVLGLSRKKADALVKHEGDWFKSFVETNPDFAKSVKAAPPPSAETAETKTEKTKANNGIAPKEKPEPGKAGGTNGKSVKNMTPAELREYARANGIKLPADMTISGDTGSSIPRPQQMIK
jgi:hypothetical protein